MEVNAEQSRDMKKHTDQHERETVFPSASWGMSVSHKLTASKVSNCSGVPSMEKAIPLLSCQIPLWSIKKVSKKAVQFPRALYRSSMFESLLLL